MKKIILSVLLALSTPALARAATITFDDVSTGTGFSSITGISNGYNNLNWYNFYVASSDAYPGSNFSAGVVSGNYAALDGFGETTSTISGSPFEISSASLTSIWDSSDTVEVQGFLGGNPVFDTSVAIGSAAPASPTDFSAIDSSPIDTLNFTITGDPSNDNFAVDNIALTLVPEPASLGLLTLMGLGILRRRQRIDRQ